MPLDVVHIVVLVYTGSWLKKYDKVNRDAPRHGSEAYGVQNLWIVV